MSQLVTPPDIIQTDRVCLLVNPHSWDVEMIMHWLKFSAEKYTIHIYYNQMEEPDWLEQVAKESEIIAVNVDSVETVDLQKHSSRITLVGKNQQWPSAAEFLVDYDRKP